MVLAPSGTAQVKDSGTRLRWAIGLRRMLFLATFGCTYKNKLFSFLDLIIMAFWQVFILFSSLAAVFVLWPAIRTQVARKSQLSVGQQDAMNESVFKDHIKEVSASQERGELDDKEAESLKKDLEKTLIQENKVDPQAEQPLVANWKSRIPVIALVVAIPVVAFVFYQQRGAAEDWNIYELMTKAQTSASREEADELYSALLARTAAAPDNTQAWYLLATIAERKGEYEESVRAFKTVLEHQPEAAHVMAELANALFLQAGNVITPSVREYTERALMLEPKNTDALGLAGIAAYQAGNYQKAIDHWTLALGTFHPASPSSEAISQAIAQAQIALENSPEGAASSGSSKKAKEELSSAALTLKVSLQSGVELNPELPVFVYARAWKGPKMPLAIQKVKVGDLPLSIQLTDEMSMAEGMTLSKFSQVELVARVSLANKPVPESGDWEALLGPVTLSEQKEPVVMVISEQIP